MVDHGVNEVKFDSLSTELFLSIGKKLQFSIDAKQRSLSSTPLKNFCASLSVTDFASQFRLTLEGFDQTLPIFFCKYTVSNNGNDSCRESCVSHYLQVRQCACKRM